MSKKEAVFTQDIKNHKLKVVKPFDSSLQDVWNAWTKAEILDQWWAPEPYRAETKNMDFTEGGQWLYCMVSPEGERHWCRVDYSSIQPQKSISSAAMFCDENGNVNADFPKMYWKQAFTQSGEETMVTIEITFDKPEDMENIVKMGFEGGFNMGLNQLEKLLS